MKNKFGGLKQNILTALCCMIIFISGCSFIGSDKGTQPAVKAPVPLEAPKQTAEAYDFQNGNQFVVKIGYSTDRSDPRGVAVQRFKEIVESKTNGDILIEVHPDGQLGSDGELISEIVNGNADMTLSSAGNFAGYVMRMGISAMPFQFDNFEDAWNFMDSDLQKNINKELEEYNLYVLGYFDNGFRCITTSEKVGPIESVKDLEGINIRTSDNAIVMETMSRLGANPKVLAFSKLYKALEEGSFDAQENPIPIIYNSGFYKVQKYLAVTNHSYDAMPLVIRKDLWEMLLPSEQEIFLEATREAQIINRNLIKTQTEEYVSKLEDSGMIITYPNLEEFQSATNGVYDYFTPAFGKELIAKVKN